ncbi:hypothetical protein CR513_13517, partial [Mucuna pruriens]
MSLDIENVLWTLSPVLDSWSILWMGLDVVQKDVQSTNDKVEALGRAKEDDSRGENYSVHNRRSRSSREEMCEKHERNRREERSERRDRREEDRRDELDMSKCKKPPFLGNCKLKFYIDWELKVEQVITSFDIQGQKGVRLVVVEVSAHPNLRPSLTLSTVDQEPQELSLLQTSRPTPAIFSMWHMKKGYGKTVTATGEVIDRYSQGSLVEGNLKAWTNSSEPPQPPPGSLPTRLYRDEIGLVLAESKLASRREQYSRHTLVNENLNIWPSLVHHFRPSKAIVVEGRLSREHEIPTFVFDSIFNFITDDQKDKVSKVSIPNWNASKSSDIKCFKCLGKDHITSQCPNKRKMFLRENGDINSENSQEETSTSSSKGGYLRDLLMVRRLMRTFVGDEQSQKGNIFHSRWRKQCKCRASQRLVDKLCIPTIPHPKPYKFQWLSEHEEMIMDK